MRLALLLTGALSLNACTSLINAVTSEPIQPNPSETSIGTDIDDWQMDTMIGVNIKKASPQLASSHINISTYNKVVLLTGEVGSSELRTLAGTTARNYPSVRQVYNELKLQGSSSLLARTNDSWLTTKVKSKLLANNEIASGQIEVVTEGGIVYLMGVVSHTAADRATAVASNTGGVIKVVRVFEYLD
ncbi:MAG: BON domain-containing protein [Gammaproteobacteria bacterium]|nr:BON domain-containing protein [Gammaproteobacteria bacterium]MBQ0838252.1 BON domain-containing protein [Gammaproteobacteria bacterium]